MAKLENYKSLDQKDKFFHNGSLVYGKNVEDIFNKILQLKNGNNVIFRGVNEAKYKMFTSAQRLFLTNEIWVNNKNTDIPNSFYSNLIERILEEVKKWNGNSISNYFEAIGINPKNDIAFLSFLQHQMFPTPFLDFTKDPLIALFFSTQNFKVNENNKFGINSFVSFYWLETSNLVTSSLTLEDNIEEHELKYSEFIKSNAITILKNESPLFRFNNNPNILNQKGCFIYNYHGTNPLEEELPKLIKQVEETGAPSIRINYDEFKFHCINIHKGLIPKIRSILKNRYGIDEEFLFPNIVQNKEAILDKILISYFE